MQKEAITGPVWSPDGAWIDFVRTGHRRTG
jgi:hypothetical protein